MVKEEENVIDVIEEFDKINKSIDEIDSKLTELWNKKQELESKRDKKILSVLESKKLKIEKHIAEMEAN